MVKEDKYQHIQHYFKQRCFFSIRRFLYQVCLQNTKVSNLKQLDTFGTGLQLIVHFSSSLRGGLVL
jgi:hypothetical protein